MKITHGPADVEISCRKCGAKVFKLFVDRDAEIATHTDIDNKVGFYYGVKIVCKKCGLEHQVVMGSD